MTSQVQHRTIRKTAASWDWIELEDSFYRQDKTPVAAATGVLDQRERAVNSGAVEALSCTAAVIIQGIVGFESKSPIVEPDFLDKRIQVASCVIASDSDDIDVIVTAVKRVEVLESITKAMGRHIVTKSQAGRSALFDALLGTEKRVGDLGIEQVQCGRYYGVGKFEFVQAKTGAIGPPPTLGGSDVAVR